jgi:hypothetical protein
MKKENNKLLLKQVALVRKEDNKFPLIQVVSPPWRGRGWVVKKEDNHERKL